MKILAIETVGRTGSVAALSERQLLAEIALDSNRRSAQTLAPAIAELLAAVGWGPRAVQLVAVASGPGSFTGLRIGITTAKAFAYATGAAIVGVPTLAAIADRAPAQLAALSVVLDAERRELFVADFVRDSDGRMTVHANVRIETVDIYLASLVAPCAVTGPALTGFVERLPPGVIAVEHDLWSPTASAVGMVGHRMAEQGAIGDIFALLPHYGRQTAAEERARR
jgi:tRNA threonylcarbamoyladenosine biosynthesis protein TsaB